MGSTSEADRRPRNALLASLPATDLERLWPRLSMVTLRKELMVLKPGEPVDHVLFPETGVISMIAALEDGSRVEVGMVGFEGFAGLSVLFGTDTAGLEGMVQVPGTALRMSAGEFRTSLADVPALMPTLLRYADAFTFGISMAVACNARHPIEQRLARWLLIARDRCGENSFLMTQEFMSIMLGVRRSGVTLAIGALQRAGLVTHIRGTLTIDDGARLEQVACDCYNVAADRLRTVMGQVAGG